LNHPGKNNQTVSYRLHEELSRIISATPPGGKLLNEPDLAKQLGVSRATLREAMRTFETQGMLRKQQGSGTYVNHPSKVFDSGLEILESIETLAERNGLIVTMGALSIENRPAQKEECLALGLETGCEVISVTRVILAENRPVAYLVDTLPANILTSAELQYDFTGSILDLLLRRGEPSLQISRTEINAVTASSTVARALGIQRGDVLLRFIAYLFPTNGRVIDYSYSYFLPGYFRFHVVRRVG
jgi:GntR family transcriptional regulator